MKVRRSTSAGLLSLAVVLASCFSQAAEAATFVGGTGDWTFVSAPTVQSLGFSQAAAVTFENHLGVAVLGIVIMVLHNDHGQTVYYSTATINITRGFYGTAYAAEVGVQPGIYNATIFAISTQGLAISNSTKLVFPAR